MKLPSQGFSSSRFAGGASKVLRALIAASLYLSVLAVAVTIQPVEAGPITIDNFQIIGGTSTAGTDLAVAVQFETSGSFGGFDTRDERAATVQFSTTRSSRTSTAQVAGGNGTLLLSSDGTGTAPVNGDPNAIFGYYNSSFSPVNLTANGQTTLKVVTGPTSSTSLPGFTGWLYAEDNAIGFVITPSFWAPNTTYYFPFSAFTGVDFSNLRRLEVGIIHEGSVGGSTAFTATSTFTTISAVPEPSTYAMALAGIACGGFSMWRRRKRA